MVSKKKLGEILVESKLLTGDQITQALVEQKKTNMKLGQFLMQQGNLLDTQLTDLLSKQLKIEKYHPHKYSVDEGLSDIIPFEAAQKHHLVPLKKSGRLLTIAMVDPLDITALDSIESMADVEVEPVVCTEREMNQLINSVYGTQSGISGTLEDIDTGDEQASKEEDVDVQVVSLEEMAGEADVVRLVNSIFDQAIREGVSDIHICPQRKSVHLRFRIDGKLQDVKAPSKKLIAPTIARLKILSNMDITASRAPQDGRFTLNMKNKEINVRTSTIPTIYGENMVLRLLDMSAVVYKLNYLGMDKENIDKIKNIIHKPYGLILSTGPAGSGKSTSLYSILNEINKPDINIITLEDPVEYRIDNIRQVQLNEKAGMTFANGLSSILRQDPDVIMVGEIRDSETAAIAVQAAQTGHRVLSTIHTNDASGAITRLTDMGIEPYLISSSLLVSFAQRLLRTVCSYCKKSYKPSKEELDVWGLDNVKDADFQRGKGCNQCMNTGYKGRTGVFEVLIIDEMIQEMIMKKVSSREITREAVAAKKLINLKTAAANKVIQGITTFEEATAVVMI